MSLDMVLHCSYINIDAMSQTWSYIDSQADAMSQTWSYTGSHISRSMPCPRHGLTLALIYRCHVLDMVLR
ncbi:hypothetical protein F383_00869 [Gossypium arboreum]|uniref:Uncharacterized protein n=1 Tax=Gossypium arboreum TaxID=29729 RepID=A0A0B0PM21_GOSAR|nr:hypothetical protein F383_00869 [Gossypium arboreum]